MRNLDDVVVNSSIFTNNVDDITKDVDDVSEDLDPLWNSQIEEIDLTCKICTTNDTDAMNVDR